jgi:hypothetical protein
VLPINRPHQISGGTKPHAVERGNPYDITTEKPIAGQTWNGDVDEGFAAGGLLLIPDVRNRPGQHG